MDDLLLVINNWECPTFTESAPSGILDCINRYSDNIEKLEACIEAMLLNETP